MNELIIDQEISRLEDSLSLGDAFLYREFRGSEKNEEKLYNFVVWEVTDFVCERTGKYSIIKEELSDFVSDAVKMIAGALTVYLDIISSATLLIIEKTLNIVLKYAANGACKLLPMEPPE